MIRIRDFLRWYIRSPLGITVLVASAFVGVLSGLFFTPLPAVCLGALLFLITSSAVFASGAGAKAAARERDRETDESRDTLRESAEKLRDRIASLRIPDPEVAKAVSGFVLAIGECLEACRREGTRDPASEEAASGVLDAITIYLRELDGTAVERRFDLADADPFPEAKERTLSYLRERTTFVLERRIAVDGGLGGGDRLGIREELR